MNAFLHLQGLPSERRVCQQVTNPLQHLTTFSDLHPLVPILQHTSTSSNR